MQPFPNLMLILQLQVRMESLNPQLQGTLAEISSKLLSFFFSVVIIRRSKSLSKWKNKQFVGSFSKDSKSHLHKRVHSFIPVNVGSHHLQSVRRSSISCFFFLIFPPALIRTPSQCQPTYITIKNQQDKRERALNMLPSSHDFRLISCLPPFLLKLISTYQLLKSAWERKNIDLIWRILGDNNEVMDIKHITRHTTHNLRMYFYNSQS